MKKILVLLTLSLVLFLTGCHVKDKNGEDNFELATYTIEDVKNSKIRSNSSYMNVSFGTLNQGYVKVKKFSGQRELVSKSVKSGDMVKITSTVEKGNLGIFIKCNDSYYQIPINTKYTFTFNNYSGTCKIIFVGESAQLRIDYDFI